MASKKKAQKSAGVSVERLRQFIRSEGARFLADANVTSIGIGRKVSTRKSESGEDLSGQICVQFTVRKKGEPSELEALGTDPIPKAITIDGVEVLTDVLQRSYESDLRLVAPEIKSARKRRLDPVAPGVSVGHPDITAGTLGAIVYDANDGTPCMLSNWHVLHGNSGRIGDRVVQPGTADDNNVDGNYAGTLLRSHLGVSGDCAIARIEGRGFDSTIIDLATTPRRLAEPELDDVLVKSGRTTCVTYGVVRRTDVIAKIDYGAPKGEVNIGCFEIGPHPDRPALNDEISMGGDSGCLWVAADDASGDASDIAVGLHFGGESQSNPDEHALACYVSSVFNKLAIRFDPVEAGQIPGAEIETAKGYDESFLGTKIAVPWLDYLVWRDDAVRLNGSHLIPYAHFSVCQSRARRFARFVAWNIDGGSIRKLSRNGLKFRTDPRVGADVQVDNDAYKDNNLDRGHVARRADLCWGPLTEAERANSDSFYFTNITPQHASFNQSSRGGLWGGLENAIFEDVDVDDLRVSLFGGPVFRDDDIVYRGVRIPRDFWKVIAYRENGRLKARGYVLTQRDLLNDIEVLDLDPFRMFQVSLEDLGEMTEMEFRDLLAADTLGAGGESTPEARGLSGRSVREVVSREDVVR